MTDLTFDQLLDLTECVALLIKPSTLAGLEALTLFESVVVTVNYLRQNVTEDFLAAIFDRLAVDGVPPADPVGRPPTGGGMQEPVG